ncbi:MAG: cellulase family glycosylhydrolase [Lachnospiraceae bacterium]|nr:cellulase family glycosylhydrolase [Lachnospiraceae bacterium]
MRFKKFSAILMAVVMSLSMLGVAGVADTKASAASFQELNQSQIVEAMGAGWNLGNQLESVINGIPHETNWGNPTISENLIKAVKNAGFKSIRVPVSYFSKIGGGPSYTIDAAWLNRVQEVVDMCIKYNLYVIINIHGDGYNTIDGGWLLCNAADQAAVRKKYEACWKQIANKFKDYDQHLIFESMNEEFDGTYGTPNRTYYANINSLNQIFVDTVRKTGGNNAKRWLMLPGWNTDIEYTVGDYGFVIPSDNYRSSTIPSNEKRIMISVHYYSPYDFCLAENGSYTQWGVAATDSSKVPGYSDEASLKDAFGRLKSKFTSKGYPVVIGEYGAVDKSHHDSQNAVCRIDFAAKVCGYARQNGCVPVWWDNGVNGAYGLGLFNRNTCQVTQQSIIDAIMSAFGGSGDVGIDTNKRYMLKNVNSGLYMDVSGGYAANGANVLQYSASGAKNNNTWKFVPAGDGYYYIYSALGNGNTFLLDVADNSSANGANIGIWENTNCDAQLYKPVKNSDGSYTLYTKASGGKGVVEVTNADTANKGNVQQWEYNGHNCQKWYLEAVN